MGNPSQASSYKHHHENHHPRSGKPLPYNSCTHPATDKIQVTGQATMKVVPDMVELSLKSFNVRPAMKDAVIETQAAPSKSLK